MVIIFYTSKVHLQKKGAHSRWQNRKMLGSPHLINTPEIQLHIEIHNYTYLWEQPEVEQKDFLPQKVKRKSLIEMSSIIFPFFLLNGLPQSEMYDQMCWALSSWPLVCVQTCGVMVWACMDTAVHACRGFPAHTWAPMLSVCLLVNHASAMVLLATVQFTLERN